MRLLIEENNKIIAEFMGWIDPNDPNDETHESKFHYSWDWLMPVVKKIMEQDEPPKESSGWYAYHRISNELELVDINLTYEQVLEYIKYDSNTMG